MKVLIVFSHPDRGSLNGSFLDAVSDGLDGNPGVGDIEILDLYEEGFNPALIFNKNKRRRDMYKDPEFEKYRNQIEQSDTIVFIYPIWWGRPPSMLLGYFDQLLASGFAYRNVPGRIMPEGLLKNKQVICVSTMKGPAGYPAFWLRNAHKVLMKKAVFGFVGIRKVRFFEFGGMEKPDGKQAVYLERIKKAMMKLKKTG